MKNILRKFYSGFDTRVSKEVKYKICQEHRIFEPRLRLSLSSRQDLFLTKTEKGQLALIDEEFRVINDQYKKDEKEIDEIRRLLRYGDFVGAISDYAEAFVEEISVEYKELYFLVSLQQIKEVTHPKNQMECWEVAYKMFIKKNNLKEIG
ncbi:MAG: hypothetical protein ACTSPB_00295 [Candidatus Thorarchaeota archaeon]